MKPIVVVGSLNMDLVVRSPHLPRPGETLIGGPFQTFPGGKGANQAVAAARLGATVHMIGRVGADAFGEQLLQSAAADGVDVSAVLSDAEAASGVALITVDAAGQNTIVVASGANMRLSVTDIDALEALIASAALLVMQLESPLDVVEQAACLARKHEVRVLLNPAPARALPESLLRLVDVLLPNQNELARLAGGDLPVPQAARRLQQQGAGTVVVTLGDQGLYLLGPGIEVSLPAHRVEVVDTVAAGDAFVGAFAVALAEGRSLLEAARWGNAAGALAVTKPGAQPSLPSRSELLELLGKEVSS